MRLVVTGGAGFVGSRTVRHAIAAGHEVISVDGLTSSASLSGIWDLEDHPKYGFEPADITDLDRMSTIFEQFQPDAVLHLAYEPTWQAEVMGPQAAATTNMMGTLTLLDAARGYWQQRGCPDDFRFVQTSNSNVFGACAGEFETAEDSAFHPETPVAATVAAADHLTNAWHAEFRLPTLIARADRLFGPRQMPSETIPLALIRALSNQRIPPAGRGVADWLHVDDFAHGLLAVLDRGIAGRSYHLVGNARLGEVDVLRALCRLLQARVPSRVPYTELMDAAPTGTAEPIAAFRSLHGDDALAWNPLLTFEAGLAQTLDWYLANETWWRPLVGRKARAGCQAQVAA